MNDRDPKPIVRLMCCAVDWCLHGYDDRPLPPDYVWEERDGHKVPIYTGPTGGPPLKLFLNGVEQKQGDPLKGGYGRVDSAPVKWVGSATNKPDILEMTMTTTPPDVLDVKRIRETLALLDSMIHSGEKHSTESTKALSEARASLEAMRTLLPTHESRYFVAVNGQNIIFPRSQTKMPTLDDVRMLMAADFKIDACDDVVAFQQTVVMLQEDERREV